MEALSTLANARLITDSQTLDKVTVSLNIVSLQVIQKTASLANHLQQATAGMMVLGMILQMSRQLIDPLGEQCHLHFRGAGILWGPAISRNNFCFLFL